MATAITMGMVGGLRAPREFEKALRDFDPDLSVRWDYHSQAWMITQRVRRCRHVGEADGMRVSAVEDVEFPVMNITNFPGALDSRIIKSLQEERAVTLREYEKLLVKRQKDRIASGKAAGRKRIEGVAEEALNYWYDPVLRNQLGLSPRVRGWRPDQNDDKSKPKAPDLPQA